jgi:hypothetical protein
MIINKQEVNIDDLVNEKHMHKKVNNIYLSQYQIDILNSYDIDPNKCISVSDLLMEIDELLDEVDSPELEQISDEIEEFNYYANTNK